MPISPQSDLISLSDVKTRPLFFRPGDDLKVSAIASDSAAQRARAAKLADGPVDFVAAPDHHGLDGLGRLPTVYVDSEASPAQLLLDGREQDNRWRLNFEPTHEEIQGPQRPNIGNDAGVDCEAFPTHEGNALRSLRGRL
jgi:hypothetical protein